MKVVVKTSCLKRDIATSNPGIVQNSCNFFIIDFFLRHTLLRWVLRSFVGIICDSSTKSFNRRIRSVCRTMTIDYCFDSSAPVRDHLYVISMSAGWKPDCFYPHPRLERLKWWPALFRGLTFISSQSPQPLQSFDHDFKESLLIDLPTALL